MLEVAKSIDSYKETLISVMELIKPRRIFEWGSGGSTLRMANHPTVLSVDSVEHDREWMEKLKDVLDQPKIKVHYSPYPDIYPYVDGRYERYHLIFIDGREREECLREAKGRKLLEGGVVILHDAERERYQEPMRLFSYIILTDDGHTAVLTDDYKRHLELKEKLL